MNPAIETIGHHRQASRATLGNQGQITTIPAQGWRAVGLMARELWQGADAAVNQGSQLNRLSSALFGDHSQKAAVAADGRTQLGALNQTAGSLTDPSAAADQGQADGGGQHD